MTKYLYEANGSIRRCPDDWTPQWRPGGEARSVDGRKSKYGPYVHLKSYGWRPRHGRVDAIRTIPEGHPLHAELAEIDAARAALRAREKKAIDGAWTLLKSVKVADLKRERDERMAARGGSA